MSYIDNNLMSGEQIAYRTKLHWIIFLNLIVFAVLLFTFLICSLVGIFGYIPLILFRSLGVLTGFFLLTAIILAIIAWGISSYISFNTSEFGVTNKRVLIKVGFIKINSMETLLAKIEGIQVNQGILGRILNYGTIIITGTGGTKEPFHQIAFPLEFRKKTQEQIDKISAS